MAARLALVDATARPHRGRARSRRRRLITGAFGGVTGAWVMSRARILREADDRATATVAQAAAQRAVHRTLAPDELAALVPALRYTFGAVAGAAYATLRPSGTSIVGGGVALGLLLWAMSELAMRPAMHEGAGRERRPDGVAVSVVYHLVFGVTTDVVQRSVETIGAPTASAA